MFGLTGSVVLRSFARAAAIAAACLVLVMTANGAAKAETRTLKLYHVHLREKTEITYKRNGRFLPEGLKKANWALRDWRESKPTNMDPMLLDLLWEAYRQSGSRDYIHVIGGYRSPTTNKKLRTRSSGVAETSQHMAGKAIDFYIPDVPLRKMRDIGLKMQVGGVGYYPRSGSPFVHFDTGRGRHWPRMSRKELASVFPNGNTIHVPSDGKPLPGYEMALASYNKRRSSESIQIANASTGRSGGRSLLAAIFGGGAEEAEDNAEAEVAPAPRQQTPARAAPQPQVQVAAVQPKPQPQVQPRRPTVLPAGVAMPDRDSFDTSGRAPVPPAAVPAATEQVAVLDLARIPMPTSAPSRAAAAPVVDEAPAEASVESTLVAALESAAPSAATAGQLAYAVPMPRERPPFEAILTNASNTVAVAPVPQPSIIQRTITAALPAAAPPAPTSLVDVVAPLPSPAQKPVPSVAVAALTDAIPVAVETSSDDAAALPVRTASLETAVEGEEPSATVSPSGKSGRVLREASHKPQSTVVAIQDAIASRIEVASLVTSPERRAQEARMAAPRADMLVVDVPVSVLATGFAPKTAVGASDRFTGSAVNFLPVRKLN